MIATNIEHLGHIITEILSDEWEAQGHHMNGKIVKDIDYVVEQKGDTLTIKGMMYPYGIIQAKGAKWSKFPNVYAIQSWVRERMGVGDEKKSKSIAFAIAQVFKKSGMPTDGSLRFSQTGKRTRWIEEAFRKNEKRLEEAIREFAHDRLSMEIDAMTAQWNKEFNT